MAGVLALPLSSLAQSQSRSLSQSQSQAPGDKGAMPGMKMDAPKSDAAESSMAMGEMNMQGGAPPPDARDPDAYSDGLALSLLPGMHMADKDRYGRILIDQLEGFTGNDGSGIAVDAQAWYGGDLDKAWLKVDGSRRDGTLSETRTELLWNHAVGIYWGTQLGVRHDFGGGPGRTYAALGVQGLAPYWFDVEATAYVGEGGRTALRFEAEYELLLTQRLVLQPDVEVNVYGKNDPEREIGSGIADVDIGLRLRYEFTRKFAPYIGVSWNRKLGNTARPRARRRQPGFEHAVRRRHSHLVLKELMMKPVTRHVLATTLVLFIGAVAAAALFVWSGVYNVAADDPHTAPVYTLLSTLRERSMAVRAEKIEVPDLSDPAQIVKGAGNYQAMCMGCHLAPGMDQSEISKGLYPTPPNLSKGNGRAGACLLGHQARHQSLGYASMGQEHGRVVHMGA